MDRNQKLAELISTGDVLGFRAHIRNLLCEQLDDALPQAIEVPALTINDEAPVRGEDDAELEALNQLRQTAKHFGGDDGYYEEGLFEVCIPHKEAAADFAAFLEAYDAVDSYEMDVISTDPITGDDTADNEISLDEISDDTNKSFDFYVYLIPDIVTYEPEEVDVGEGELFDDENGQLYEVKRVIKINFRGKRRIKMQCNPGFKWDPTARTCRKISGSELATKRRSLRRAARTKKAKGASYRRKILRKTRKALRFRKALGLGS